MRAFDRPLFADYETRSRVDIKTAGQFPYTRDPSTEILMVALARDSARVITRDALSGSPEDSKASVRISWGGFDRAIYRCREASPIPNAAWFDAMQIAYFLGLPAKLENAAKVLGYDVRKDTRGSRLINRYSIPEYPNGPFRALSDNPDDERAFREYAEQDVRLMIQIWDDLFSAVLPIWVKHQHRNYGLVERMNLRGLPVDVPSCERALDIIDVQKAKLATWCEDHIGIRPTQAAPIAEYLGLPNCQKQTLEDAYPFMDTRGKKLVDARLASTRSSKVKALLEYAVMDGRAHYCFVNNGAHTGRLAGRGPQPQNMKRTKYDPVIFEQIFQAPNKIENPLVALSEAQRGFIQAPKGKTLMCSDYSQIEARVGAWLAGEDKLTEAFRQKKDVYRMMAANIYGVPIETLTKEGPERQQGKVTVLAGQYQVSGTGLMTQARGYGITDRTEDDWIRIVAAYRATMTNIVNYWWALDGKLRELVTSPSLRRVDCGHIAFDKWNEHVRMILPSGRPLWYYRPFVKRVLVKPKRGDPFEKDVTFYHSQYGVTSLYGGKIFENAVQATSADIVFDGGVEAEKRGFYLVGQVHDEWVAEHDEAVTNEADLEEFNDALCTLAPWAREIPIVAEGWIGPRYKK